MTQISLLLVFIGAVNFLTQFQSSPNLVWGLLVQILLTFLVSKGRLPTKKELRTRYPEAFAAALENDNDDKQLREFLFEKLLSD